MKRKFETDKGIIELELKKVKLLENGHGDTPTFEAQLYIDGKLAAYVNNNGWGGESEYDTYKCDPEASEKIKWCYGDKFTSFDCEVMNMACLIHETKKYQSKSWVLLEGEGINQKMYTAKFPMAISKLKKAPNFADWRDRQVTAYRKEGYQILNKNLGI